MATVDVDAILDGGASQTADAAMLYAADSTMAGAGSQTGDIGLLFSVDSTMAGAASQTAAATGLYALAAALAGSAGLTVDVGVLLSATLASAGSALTISDLFLLQGLSALLQGGGTFFQPNMTWTPHPGAPPPKPAVNAAVTLQQFIDSTGSGRSVTKTQPANNAVVDPNPPRKPFKPR